MLYLLRQLSLCKCSKFQSAKDFLQFHSPQSSWTSIISQSRRVRPKRKTWWLISEFSCNPIYVRQKLFQWITTHGTRVRKETTEQSSFHRHKPMCISLWWLDYIYNNHSNHNDDDMTIIYIFSGCICVYMPEKRTKVRYWWCFVVDAVPTAADVTDICSTMVEQKIRYKQKPQ